MIDIYRHYVSMCNVSKNKNLLRWLRMQAIKGYKPYVNIDELQDIINSLTRIYQESYPNSEFEYWSCDGMNMNYFISPEVHFGYIYSELNLEQVEFIEGYYSYNALTNSQNFLTYDNVLIPLISLELPARGYGDCKPLTLGIRADNGFLHEKQSYCGFHSSTSENVQIDIFLQELKNKRDYDTSELDKLVKQHNNNLILRRRILQMTALNIMLSNNTKLECGYERAKRFILEFNEYIPNLDLDFSEIDFVLEKLTMSDKSNKSAYVKKKYA